MNSKRYKYPFFLLESNRDEYLVKAIARGHQVKAKTVYSEGIGVRFVVDRLLGMLFDTKYYGVLYTVVDIDRRKGK